MTAGYRLVTVIDRAVALRLGIAQLGVEAFGELGTQAQIVGVLVGVLALGVGAVDLAALRAGADRGIPEHAVDRFGFVLLFVVAERRVEATFAAGDFGRLQLRVAADVDVLVARRLVVAVVVPVGRVPGEVLPRPRGDAQVHHGGVDPPVQGSARQRLGDAGRLHRDIGVRQERFVLGHATAGDTGADPGAVGNVVTGVHAELMEFIVRRQTELAAAGRESRTCCPAGDRRVGIGPEQRIVLVGEHRQVVRHLDLQFLVFETQRGVNLLGGVVDGLGQDHRARIAAGVAEHAADALVAILGLVFVAGAEIPLRRQHPAETHAGTLAFGLEIERLQTRQQLGHARGGAAADPVCRQGQVVAAGAVEDRARRVAAEHRNLVVVEEELVAALYAVLERGFARIQAEVETLEAPVSSAIAVVCTAVEQVQIQQRGQALLVESGVAAESERIVADEVGAHFDTAAELGGLFETVGHDLRRSRLLQRNLIVGGRLLQRVGIALRLGRLFGCDLSVLGQRRQRQRQGDTDCQAQDAQWQAP